MFYIGGFKMKQVTKKWLISGLITTTGVLAMIMGFSAAFGNAFGSDWAVDGMYKSLYEYASGVLKSHLGMAYIGGIIIGSIGVITTLTGLYVTWLAYTNSLPTSKKCLYSAVTFSVVIMILAIAAVACELQLNSVQWISDNMGTNPQVLAILGKASALFNQAA